MKFSKEIRLGALIIIAIGALVWGLNFLKGKNFFSKKTEFVAIYEHINGLVESNPIQINGYKVGQVSQIFFHPDKSGRIVVIFGINQDEIRLPKDSKARIFSSDLLGSKAIELILGTDTTDLQSGDTLKSDTEDNLKVSVNKQILPLKEKAEELIASMDSAVTIVQMVLNKEVRQNLKRSFEGISRAIETFEQTSISLEALVSGNRERLTDIFKNIEAISENIRNNKEQLSNAINNFSAISDSLSKANLIQAVSNASVALNKTATILDKINNGEGSLGMLIHNDSLYNDLDSAARSIDVLIKDINKHPGRYVHFSIFGKKDKGLKLTSEEEKKLKKILE